MRSLEMFFDYECPFCLQSYEELMDILPDYPDLNVVWRPCEAHPRPENHPPHTDLCIQGFYYVQENGYDVLQYHSRMFRAKHKDRIDIENPEVLAAYVKDLVPEAEFLKVLQDGQYKSQQIAANSYAYDENQVWYLPAFRLNQDKLDAKGGIGVTKQELIDFLNKK